jgi:DNA-directed RNA polymerase subunit K/omega
MIPQTIEQHEKLVGNRFTLTHLIIKRTRELMNGAPISKGIAKKFNVRGEIPNHLMAKIALEELRNGKLHWTQPSNTKPEPLISDIAKANPVVFEG